MSPTFQFLPSLITQHCIFHRKFPPLSKHKTLYRPPLRISPLSSHNTLWSTAQFDPLTSLNTLSPTYHFFLLSQQNHCVTTAQIDRSLTTKPYIAHRSISLLSQHTKFFTNRKFSPLFQYTTLYCPPHCYLPRFISPLTLSHNTVSPTLNSSSLPEHNTPSPTVHFQHYLSSQHIYRPPHILSLLSAHKFYSPHLSFSHVPAHSSVQTTAQIPQHSPHITV